MKKKLFLLLTIIGLVFTGATVNSSSVFAAAGYDIKNYDVNIEVTKDNVFLVEEKISVNFPLPKHGIFRYIPYRFPEYKGMYPYIDDIKVDGAPYEVEHESSDGYDFINLKIGDPDRTVTGDMTYVISYKYHIGGYPETIPPVMFYTLLGNMETPIPQGRIQIKLPEAIDENTIQMYQGAMGDNQPFTNFGYDKSTDTIVAEIDEPIGSYDYLSVYIPLGSSYFEGVPVLKSTYESLLPAYYIGGGILLAAAIFLFIRYGREGKVIQVVEFFPPEGLTPLELEVLLNEVSMGNTNLTSQTQKFSSLFYYGANKGYLTIDFGNEKEKTPFVLERTDKIYDADEADHVKIFLDSLFSKKNRLEKSDLKEVYYTAAIASAAGVKRQGMMNQKSGGLSFLMVILSLLLPVGILFGLFDHVGTLPWIIAIIIAIFELVYFIGVGISWEQSQLKINKSRAFPIILAVLGIVVLPGLAGITTNLPSVGILYAIFGLIVFLGIRIRQVNKDKLELLGRVSGFKQFIKVAKKPELEKLINEHPTYFYDVLPYAQAFGLTSVWSNKFRDIEMTEPEWMVGNTMMGMYFYAPFILSHNIATIDTTVQSSIATYTSSRSSGSGGSGGGFSGGGGGGFSGGGFGGGGGGSW